MIDFTICKSLDASAITDEQMENINRYSRRTLQREEVFVFTVILCDNEVDRDFERFPTASLDILAQLYLGKTGVFDHTPTAENQSARIFDAQVEETGAENSVGEPYAHLKAWAYMVRCDKNADLILEIDAGIKKEVSVGCAVEQILCSVCGADQRADGCSHQKGETVDGSLCHHLLINPIDAYEWSFVAVPAQKMAGVVKRHSSAHAPENGVEKARIRRLEQLADLGRRTETALRKNVVRLGLLSDSGLSAETLETIAARLDAPQLEALEKSFGRAARQRYPLTPQLSPADQKADASFQI